MSGDHGHEFNVGDHHGNCNSNHGSVGDHVDGDGFSTGENHENSNSMVTTMARVIMVCC